VLHERKGRVYPSKQSLAITGAHWCANTSRCNCTYPWLELYFIPGGCTGLFQPCDVAMQKPYKQAINHAQLADTVAATLVLCPDLHTSQDLGRFSNTLAAMPWVTVLGVTPPWNHLFNTHPRLLHSASTPSLSSLLLIPQSQRPVVACSMPTHTCTDRVIRHLNTMENDISPCLSRHWIPFNGIISSVFCVAYWRARSSSATYILTLLLIYNAHVLLSPYVFQMLSIYPYTHLIKLLSML
jgi:hypothetical protein